VQMRDTETMKTATLPSIRVEPALRATVESLLDAGETLSEFVENSVRQTVMRRRRQAEFLARGLVSLESARSTGEYVESDAVLEKLTLRLAMAKKRMQALNP
jgi:predicted transcriptional regulator